MLLYTSSSIYHVDIRSEGKHVPTQFQIIEYFKRISLVRESNMCWYIKFTYFRYISDMISSLVSFTCQYHSSLK